MIGILATQWCVRSWIMRGNISLVTNARGEYRFAASLHPRRRVGPGEHLLDEGDRIGVARTPRGHGLSAVRCDEALERRHGAWHSRLGDEGHDTDLGEAAVVELDEEATLLLLRRLVLGEAEGVKEIEGRVANLLPDGLERRELARLPALHVVLVHRALAPQLEASDEEENLPLGVGRDGVPLGGGSSGGGDVGIGDARERGGPGEVDAVGLDDEADEGGHGNAAVLDLGLAEEADGPRIVRGTSETLTGISEAERVPELHDRIEFSGQGLKVGLGLHAHAAVVHCGRVKAGHRRIEGKGSRGDGEHGEDWIRNGR
mmetsp:Transcript_18269/g.39257  ORF Transcript_18269/g.39257 Transcript_18269/m.39257 type:complete len:316 (-) Transcript_18269:9-956(-)